MQSHISGQRAHMRTATRLEELCTEFREWRLALHESGSGEPAREPSFGTTISREFRPRPMVLQNVTVSQGSSIYVINGPVIQTGNIWRHDRSHSGNTTTVAATNSFNGTVNVPDSEGRESSLSGHAVCSE